MVRLLLDITFVDFMWMQSDASIVSNIIKKVTIVLRQQFARVVEKVIINMVFEKNHVNLI